MGIGRPRKGLPSIYSVQGDDRSVTTPDHARRKVAPAFGAGCCCAAVAKPVVSTDEFGFDFGGQTDQKSATILRQTRRVRPELALTVWEMRGPIPKILAEAYRDVVNPVMLECYVGEKKDYWWIVTQVHAARMHGLLPKTIVALGLGKGGNPGEDWARTKEELEQQVRFVRLIAPELTAPVVISLTIERPRGVNQGPAGFVSLEYCRIKGEFIKEMLGALLPNVVFPVLPMRWR